MIILSDVWFRYAIAINFSSLFDLFLNLLFDEFLKISCNMRKYSFILMFSNRSFRILYSRKHSLLVHLTRGDTNSSKPVQEKSLFVQPTVSDYINLFGDGTIQFRLRCELE